MLQIYQILGCNNLHFHVQSACERCVLDRQFRTSGPRSHGGCPLHDSWSCIYESTGLAAAGLLAFPGTRVLSVCCNDAKYVAALISALMCREHVDGMFRIANSAHQAKVAVDVVYCTSLGVVVTGGLDRQLRLWNTRGLEQCCWPLPGKSLPTKLAACGGAAIACGFQDGAVWYVFWSFSVCCFNPCSTICVVHDLQHIACICSLLVLRLHADNESQLCVMLDIWHVDEDPTAEKA